jgi:alpha 1,2-mannosyltransferase
MLQYGLDQSEWDLVSPPPYGSSPRPRHAPPLFVHANLLKHADGTKYRALRLNLGREADLRTDPSVESTGYHRNNTFQVIKFPIPDYLSPISSDIRFGIYHHRGLCTDIWDSKGLDDGSGQGEFERGRVEVVSWSKAWGGMLSGFEEVSLATVRREAMLMGWCRVSRCTMRMR